MDKSALEALLSTYNWWMGVSTIAVAMGILGEYVAHFWFDKGKRNRLEIAISILFGALVLGGVTGEYIFGSKLSAASEALQRMADTEVARLNREAEEARGAASGALERIAAAQEETAKASAQAAQANERAHKLEVEAAEQRERAAKAERDLLALQQQLAWRTVSGEQRQIVITSLASFRGEKLEVFIISGSEEVELFGQQLAGAFRAAGVEVDVNIGQMMGVAESGLVMEIGNNRLHFASAIAGALLQAKIISEKMQANKIEKDADKLILVVWPKGR